jgi:hypothetical protein
VGYYQKLAVGENCVQIGDHFLFLRSIHLSSPINMARQAHR